VFVSSLRIVRACSYPFRSTSTKPGGAMTSTDDYLLRMEGCARAMGRPLAPVTPQDREVRLHERDTALVERGFAGGLLQIEEPNRVRTCDPFQGTAWLVEGTPARLCWEYVPHMAAYVELVEKHAYPTAAIRFETPDPEMNLDLAVLNEDGHVLVLGEVKREARQLESLERVVGELQVDPGKAAPRTAAEAPQGTRREGWKLAHQLWQTRAPYLWLVASGARRVFDVDYSDRISLNVRPALPSARELWPSGFDGPTPRISLLA
jgi:hypothetical protein